MKSLVKFFGLFLMASLLFVGCPAPTESDTPNTPDTPNEPNDEFKLPENYKPFANLTEDTAHPMKYIVDFADLVDFVKGKDTNVSEDGIFTVGNNEEYGDPDMSDRQTYINVTGMFKNNLPKAGDVIELHGKFTSDIDIDNMKFMIVDGSILANNWWRAVKDVPLDSKVLKNDVTKFKIECPVLDDYAETILFVIAYGKHNADGAYAKLKFEHCVETNVKPMSALSVDKKVEAISDANSSGIQLKINMAVPEDAVNGEVVVYNAEDTSFSYTIKFDAKDKTVDIPYVTAGKTYYLKLKYFDKDSKEVDGASSLLRVKAESGEGFENAPGLPKVYEVDFTPYMTAMKSDDWGDAYGCGCDVTAAFKTVPKKGDILKYTFTGTFSTDIDRINVYDSYENTPGEWRNTWSNWGKSVEIKAKKEVTISGTAVFDWDARDTIRIQFSYSKEYGECIFTPKGCTVHEIDFTPYMTAQNCQDWGDGYGLSWEAEGAFETVPKKGDIIKYTFTGTFSTDIDRINVYDSYYLGEWRNTWSDWNKTVEIKANKEVTISGSAVFDWDAIETFNIRLRYDKECGECIFTPKGWKGTVHEVDFTPYMTAMSNMDWGDAYGCGCDVTDAFKTIPKKGDLLKYTFTGTFSIDIDRINVYDSYYLGEWRNTWSDWNKTVEIKANKEVTISGSAVFDWDAIETFNIRLRYDKECGECIFTPKDWKGTIHEVDFTPYLQTFEFRNWNETDENHAYGNDFDVTEIFETLPMKGDLIKYTVTGTFSNDIDIFSVYFDTTNDNFERYNIGGNWCMRVAIKENQKVTISESISVEKDSQDKLYLCLTHNKKSGRSTFTPSK